MTKSYLLVSDDCACCWQGHCSELIYNLNRPAEVSRNTAEMENREFIEEKETKETILISGFPSTTLWKHSHTLNKLWKIWEPMILILMKSEHFQSNGIIQIPSVY